MSKIFPAQWNALIQQFQIKDSPEVIQEIYQIILNCKPEELSYFANAWCEWEDTHISLVPGFIPYFATAPQEFKNNFALLVTHYWSHYAFLKNDEVINELDKLKNKFIKIIHGQYDISSPLKTSYEIKDILPQTEIILCNDGHGGENISGAILKCAEQFKLYGKE